MHVIKLPKSGKRSREIEFLEKIKESFEVEEAEESPYAPKQKKEFGIFSYRRPSVFGK